MLLISSLGGHFSCNNSITGCWNLAGDMHIRHDLFFVLLSLSLVRNKSITCRENT